MPEGLVRWFDPVHGDAEVVRDGHAYHAPDGAVEAAARHPGARVHFDLALVDGVEQAVDVRLRQSARASRHRHRFGTLSSATHFDTKGRAPFAAAHPDLHLAGSHPLQLARNWATSVANGDATGAFSLYAPDAIVHAGDLSISGRALRPWLEALPAFGCRRHARIDGRDDRAAVVWESTVPGEPELRVTCRMAHGEIAEQWELETVEPVGPAGPARPAAAGGEDVTGGQAVSPVALFTVGDVGERAKEEARRVVERVMGMLTEPVLFARVKLAYEPDPARTARARADALLDLNGEPLRVHATARTMAEALDVLEGRLRDRLEHRAERRLELHRSDGVATSGEWRHSDLPAPRAASFDRPVEERQLVRHKTFAIGEITCDEAIFDMVQMDYDFYLFVDLASGLDAMMERAEGGYRMTRLRSSDAGLGLTAEPVELSDTEVPVLGLQEAIERLGASGERRLFFADERTGRGCILYLRYDGHYGLITPD